jgi:predicted  nucleic acid-binding Zn-ribbon protein
VSRDALEALLLVRARDAALERLRHRRATLPARAELERARDDTAARERAVAELRARRDDVLGEEGRLDDEARRLSAKAEEVDGLLYSGTIASPRELQALQADLEQLRRHQRTIEDRELEQMEARERLDAELADGEAALGTARSSVEKHAAELASAEAGIDAEIATEEQARGELVTRVPADLVADYERRRERSVGIARLVGNTCQGCHLSVPATEAERIRRADGEIVAPCDNCGCILVPE